MRRVKIAVTLVLLVLFTIVVMQNTDMLFAWDVTMSQIVLLGLTLLAGFV